MNSELCEYFKCLDDNLIVHFINQVKNFQVFIECNIFLSLITFTSNLIDRYPSRQKFEKPRLNTQNYTFPSVFRRPKKTERLNACSSRFSSMNTIAFSVHTFHKRLYGSKASFLIV